MFWLKHPQDRREITVTQAFTHKVTCHVDLKHHEMQHSEIVLSGHHRGRKEVV